MRNHTTYNRLYIGPLREAGAFALEVHSALDKQLNTTALAVVYADRNEPSHCVRLFVCDENS